VATTGDDRTLSARVVPGLLVVIAAVDLVTTRLASPAVDPLFRGAVVAGLLVWARRGVGLS